MLRASPRTPKLSDISDYDFNRAYFKELKANRYDNWTGSDLSDVASSDHKKRRLTRIPQEEKHRAKIALRANRRFQKIRRRRGKKSVPSLPMMLSRNLRWSRSPLRWRSPSRRRRKYSRKKKHPRSRLWT
jgi:hypothetical protein